MGAVSGDRSAGSGREAEILHPLAVFLFTKNFHREGSHSMATNQPALTQVLVAGTPVVTGQGDGKETTASDKAIRPGGAYLVRGVYVDAHGNRISSEELAELGLKNVADDDQSTIAPGGAGTAGTNEGANAENQSGAETAK